jgi:hypothetical protein
MVVLMSWTMCRTAANITPLLRSRHNKHQPPLLQLPDSALYVIAKKMGKRARLICSQLRSVYGSPGAALRLSTHATSDEQVQRLLLNPCSIIRAWRYPDAVRSLDVGYSAATVVDGACCQAIAEALPNLRELTACYLDPLAGTSWPSASLTALSSLRIIHPFEFSDAMQCVAAVAPHLHALSFAASPQIQHAGPGDAAWRALASLGSLQRLHIPARCSQLTSAGFSSAMRYLTALTHLGLTLDDGWYEDHPAGGALQGFTQALLGLPLLASINIDNVAPLGPSLGPALQAVRLLSSLQLSQWGDGGDAEDDEDESEEVPPNVDGCLPRIRAMPHLQQLTLHGGAIAGSQEFWRMHSGGSATVNVVDVCAGRTEHVPAVCSMASCPL